MESIAILIPVVIGVAAVFLLILALKLLAAVGRQIIEVFK